MSIKNSHNLFLKLLFGEGGEPQRKIFRTIKAKARARRTNMEKLADDVTSIFGSGSFLTINILVFAVWIFVNSGLIAGLPVFDPFPFVLLTTIVSLEAIILSIFVLIAQNRTSKVDDLREEIHLQLNIISEREITKLIKMMAMLLEKQGTDLSGDPELKKMLKPVSEEEIERRLEKEIL